MLGLSDTVEAFMLLFFKIRRKVAQYLIKGDKNIPYVLFIFSFYLSKFKYITS
jgi:hypothetical protein